MMGFARARALARPGILLSLLAVLTGCQSTPSGPIADTGAEGAVTPKVKRLVLGIGTPTGAESNRTTQAITLSYWPLNPMYDFLLGVTPEGKEPIPQLATEWALEPDGASYRFKLRSGIMFHQGKGEVTAKDVRFTWENLKTETEPLSPQPLTVSRQQIKDVEVRGDYEAVFKLDKPDSGFLTAIGQAENLLPIISKADGESRPRPGIGDKPIVGTGPYQFVSRQAGAKIIYERSADNHWRKTPDFPEFEWRFFREPSTMLAASLTREVQVAAVTPELVPQAVQSGLKAVPSLSRGLHISGSLKGVWINRRFRPEEKLNPDPNAVFVNPNTPLLDVRVRRALDKAIDRDALNKAFIRGVGRTVYNNFFDPSRPGWNPDWEKNFKDEYGYDPDAAKRLLAEAGYGPNNPVVLPMRLTRTSYFPAAPDVAEAISNYWRAVGVNSKLEEPDAVAQAPKDRALESGDFAGLNVTSIRQTLGAGMYNTTDQNSRGQPVLPELDRLFPNIRATLDPAKLDPLWREFGDIAYKQHVNIPLFWLPSEAVIDPNIVADYPFPGSIGGTYTHVEYIKAAR